MNSGVYCITNKLSGKQYVGSSVNIPVRVKEHLAGRGSRLLAYAIKKYGLDHFDWCVLESCDPAQNFIREQHWITALRPAYNLSSLATGMTSEQAVIRSSSPQWRAKTSELARARNRDPIEIESKSQRATAQWQDPEIRSRQVRRIQEVARSPESREKVSAREKLRCADPAVRAAMSARAKERCACPQYRAALSQRVREQHARRKLAKENGDVRTESSSRA